MELPLERYDFPVTFFLTVREAGDMGPSWRHPHPDREALMATLTGPSGGTPGLAMVRQIHSRIVRRVDGIDEASQLRPGDGMITDNPGVVLGITVADCMPICLYDSTRGVLALLHSGWRGTGIVRNALAVMESVYGTKPSDVESGLGPSIGACCYAVDADRGTLFARRFGPDAVVHREGGVYLDLPAANRSLLQAAGVGRILDFHRCTACNPRYGSYRREGPQRFTRMLAIASLEGLEMTDAKK